MKKDLTAAASGLMPAVFFGHGSPMHALGDDIYTQTWQALGRQLPRPQAILMVSAHWTTHGTQVTAMAQPRTIHDFGGFPQALFDMRYRAPGSPALAQRVQQVLAPLTVGLDHDWGFDHGAWAVLGKAYPEADIPVVQLSLDLSQPPSYHFALGQKLALLRREGIMIAGSGNVVHNLRRLAPGAAAHDWAQRFNERVRRHLAGARFRELADFAQWGDDARLAVPTVEHYLPLLYVLGAASPGERAEIAVDGIEMGSLSMLTAVVGAAA